MLLLVKRIKKSLAEMYVCNWLTVPKPSFQSLSVWIFYFFKLPYMEKYPVGAVALFEQVISLSLNIRLQSIDQP